MKSHYVVAICGNYREDNQSSNGQSIKTKIVTGQLEKVYGANQVKRIDTSGRNIVHLLARIFTAFLESENVILIPGMKALSVLAPVFAIYNQLFHRKLIYIVIGGWLCEYLQNRRIMRSVLKRFSCILVETNTLKVNLNKMGYQNIGVLKNFKCLKAITEEENLFEETRFPYQLCMFSRITAGKGIEEAIAAVENVNKQLGKTVFCLDIFGDIWADYKSRFEEIAHQFPAYIRYKGVAEYQDSVNVLRNYFALLFPTKFYTEGMPGTIIDAYAAGLPVIASKWESFSDVIDDGETGIGFEFGCFDELERVLISIVNNPSLIKNKRIACIRKAKEYTPERNMNVLLDIMSGDVE